MKQLQNGVYTFTIGEKDWGEEANYNFEVLDSLIKGLEDNTAKCADLENDIKENAKAITQNKTDIYNDLNQTKNEIQEQIDIINNNALALKYQLDNISNIDEAMHASEADIAILAYKANVAKQLENSLTIGNIVFDGSANTNVLVDGTPVQNSSNLINSSAVYNGLETKQDKATTIKGYNITDAYTKTEVNNLLSQGNSDAKSYTDTKVANLVSSAPETLDTLNELANALGNDPNFATTTANQIGLKANDSEVVHKTGNETINGVKTFKSTINGSINGNAETANNNANGHTLVDTIVKNIAINGKTITVTKLDGTTYTLTTQDTTYTKVSEFTNDSGYITSAGSCTYATSAGSVVWDNVSGKPSTYTPSSHTHDDRYYTESEMNTKLNGKSDTNHNHDTAYLGINAKAVSASSADSVAWNNVTGKPSTYTPSSHTHDDRYYTESEVNSLLGGKSDTSHNHDDRYYTESEINTKLNGKSDTSHTHSQYLTGITKAMVTTALGYTPPTQDTNTTYSAGSNITLTGTTFSLTKANVVGALGYTPPTSDTNTTYSAGSNLSLSGTTFNVSTDPSFNSVYISGYKLSIG